MGSKCCKCEKDSPSAEERFRRELLLNDAGRINRSQAGSRASGADNSADEYSYRASNNNLYPLRISEIRPVDRSNQLYTFVPPTGTSSSPTFPVLSDKNKNKKISTKKNLPTNMTLITASGKSNVGGPGAGSTSDEGGGPPIFLRQLNDSAIKVGTKARLLVELDPNFGTGNSNEILKVTWFRNEQKINPGGETQQRFVRGADGRFHFLDIMEVHIEDEGKWICVVENFHGRNSSTCNVKVLVPKSYKPPEFVEGLKAILTEAGTVSLECKVVGTPTCTLRWYKDGKEIKAGDIFALKGDAAIYTVEASNCMASVTSSSKVHMGSESGSIDESERITIVQHLMDGKVRVGDKCEFIVRLNRMKEGMKVNWYNKSKLIESNDRFVATIEGSAVKLFINQVSVQDDGQWTCEITSLNQKVVSSAILSILIPRNYRKPRFLENLKAILTEEGLVSFECKVCGFPTPVLRWYKDGYELKPGDVYQLSGANSLGVYKCVAVNVCGDAESSTELTLDDIQHQLSDDEKKQLLSEGSVSQRPPKFLKGLKSMELKIGEPCELQVQINDTKASVIWFRDGCIIENTTDDKYSILSNEGTHTIKIKNLELEDQAEWKCTGSNEFGHTVSSSRIKLIIPPHFKKPKFLEPLRAILSEEGTVNLECKVIGVPVPCLKWYKDNVELKAGDIHRIISGADGTCCLGTYTCEAKNLLGTVSSSAALLGFEDKLLPQKSPVVDQRNLTRDPSLSTILEERSSQMLSACETPMANNKSIEEDARGEISLSIDGKEVSVSLYETPDLTENDAKQILEMFADQYSEYISEHNIVPLPSLRFMKETSTSGNIVMEAVVIDVTDDPFESAKSVSMAIVREDQTEGDVDEISDSFESPLDLSSDAPIPERKHSGQLSRSRKSSAKKKSQQQQQQQQQPQPQIGETSQGQSEEMFLTAESEQTMSHKFAELQETIQSLREAETFYASAESEGEVNEAFEKISSPFNNRPEIAQYAAQTEQQQMSLMEESLKALSSTAMNISKTVAEAVASPHAGLVCEENVHLTQLESLQLQPEDMRTLCDVSFQPFHAIEGETAGYPFETLESNISNQQQYLEYGEQQLNHQSLHHPLGQEMAQPYSQIQSLHDQDHLEQEEVGFKYESGERFIGIEMAEMVLEGADTFSDIESISAHEREASSGVVDTGGVLLKQQPNVMMGEETSIDESITPKSPDQIYPTCEIADNKGQAIKQTIESNKAQEASKIKETEKSEQQYAKDNLQTSEADQNNKNIQENRDKQLDKKTSEFGKENKELVVNKLEEEETENDSTKIKSQKEKVEAKTFQEKESDVTETQIQDKGQKLQKRKSTLEEIKMEKFQTDNESKLPTEVNATKLLSAELSSTSETADELKKANHTQKTQVDEVVKVEEKAVTIHKDDKEEVQSSKQGTEAKKTAGENAKVTQEKLQDDVKQKVDEETDSKKSSETQVKKTTEEDKTNKAEEAEAESKVKLQKDAKKSNEQGFETTKIEAKKKTEVDEAEKKVKKDNDTEITNKPEEKVEETESKKKVEDFETNKKEDEVNKNDVKTKQEEDKEVKTNAEEIAAKKKTEDTETKKKEVEVKEKADKEAKQEAEPNKNTEEVESKTKPEEDSEKKSDEIENKKKQEAETKKDESEAKEKAMQKSEEAEAKQKAEEEIKKKAEEKSKQDAESKKKEDEAKKKAEEEVKQKEAETKKKEEIEAKEKAEKDAKQKQEADAKKKEEEAKKKEEAEAKKKEEEEIKKKEVEAKTKAENDAKQKQESEAKNQAEEEAKKKADDTEAKKKELEAKEKAEKEAKKKAEEIEAKKKAEEAEAQKREEEAKKKEAEAKKKQEEEVQKKEEVKKKELEAKEKAENEAKQNQEAEAKKAEKETKKKAEEAKKKAEEIEAKKKAEEIEAKKKAKDIEAKKKAEEIEAKKKAEEIEAKKKAEEIEAKKKAKDIEAKKKAEEIEAKKKAEEIEAKKKAKDIEAKKKAEEIEAKKKAEEIEAKKKAEEIEAKKKAEEIEAKKKAKDIEAKKKAEEIEAKKKAEEIEAKKKAEEIEAKKKAEEIEAKKKAEEIEAKKKAEEIEAKKKAEEIEAKKKAEEIEAKKKAKDIEAKKKAEEIEAKKKAEEIEAKKKAEEIEAKKKAEEIEAKKKAEEVETKKKAEEVETKKKAEEVETKKKAEEVETKKKAEEVETKKKAEALEAKKKEEEAKKKAEEVEAKKKTEEAKKKSEEEAKKRSEEAEIKKKEEAEAKKKSEEAESKKKEELETKKKAEEAEAKKKADEEKAKKEELEAKQKREKDAKEKQEAETNKKAEEAKKKEEESKKKAEEEAKQKADIEAKKKAEEAEAKKKAESLEAEAKKTEEEAKKKSEEEAKKKADGAEAKKKEEAKKKTDEEAKKKQETEDKKKAEENKKKEELETKKKEEAKKKAEEEAESKKKELEAKEKAEKDAKQKEEAKKAEEAKKKAEIEAKEKAEKEANQKQETETKKKAEEEAKKKAEEETKKKTEETEAKKKADQEVKQNQETEAKQKEEAEAKKKTEEAESKKKADADAKEKQKVDELEAKKKVKVEPDAESKTKAEEDAAKKTQEEAELKNKSQDKKKDDEDATKVASSEGELKTDTTESIDKSGRPPLEKRPSLDDSLKLSSVKKVNKIELQSLKLSESPDESVKPQKTEEKDESTADVKSPTSRDSKESIASRKPSETSTKEDGEANTTSSRKQSLKTGPGSRKESIVDSNKQATPERKSSETDLQSAEAKRKDSVATKKDISRNESLTTTTDNKAVAQQQDKKDTKVDENKSEKKDGVAKKKASVKKSESTEKAVEETKKDADEKSQVAADGKKPISQQKKSIKKSSVKFKGEDKSEASVEGSAEEDSQKEKVEVSQDKQLKDTEVSGKAVSAEEKQKSEIVLDNNKDNKKDSIQKVVGGEIENIADMPNEGIDANSITKPREFVQNDSVILKVAGGKDDDNMRQRNAEQISAAAVGREQTESGKVREVNDDWRAKKENVTQDHKTTKSVVAQRDNDDYGRIGQRSRSYDQLPGQLAGDYTSRRGVVTVGPIIEGTSPYVIMAQDRMESLGYFSSGSRKNLLQGEDSKLMDLGGKINQRQYKYHGDHHHPHRDEDSLAELDDLPSDKLPAPPVVPPRLRRQRLYQTKLSSEAEDLSYHRDYTKYSISTAPNYNNMPSYFTVPSVGYSYFSMASLPGSSAAAGATDHLDETARRRKPRFSMKLQDRTTSTSTECVKFTGTVFGCPEPTLQWYKNGLPIFSDRQKYTITNCHGVAVLDIHHIDKNDEGEYTAFARNFYGKAASSAILRVIGVGDNSRTLMCTELGTSACSKPLAVNFTTEIIETYFPEVNELVLECQVSGNPKPQIMWMKNGTTIIDFEQTTYGRFRAEHWVIFETGKCRLIIQRPRESDSGVYTVVGRNYDSNVGGRRMCMSDEITKLVHVKQQSAPGGIYAYVPPKGTVGGKSTSFEYQSPTFLTPLDDFKKHYIGEDLILTVEVLGTPQPVVRWFFHKNSTYPLQPSSRHRILNEAPGVHTLYIPEATAYDLGTYVVKVGNKYGNVESSCSVSEYIRGLSDDNNKTSFGSTKKLKTFEKEQIPPVFLHEPPDTLYLRCGDDLVIDCQVDGWPHPTVNLYRGCRNVTLQPRAYKELLPQVSAPDDQQNVRFTVSKLQFTDFGLYTIEAKNIVGVAKCFTNLKIVDRAHSMTPVGSTRSLGSSGSVGSMSRLDKPYYPTQHSRSFYSSSKRSYSTHSLAYSSFDY